MACRSYRLPYCLTPMACAIIMGTARADSGIGVDTWRGNKLDPTSGHALQVCDERGTTWLSPLRHRSPTGNLYNCPSNEPLTHDIGEWLYYGVLQAGYVGTGDQRVAQWNRYSGWPSDSLIFGLLDVHLERPSDGSYAEARGSRLSEEDQYFQMIYGKAGAYKAQAYMRNVPNILSTNAKSIWDGAGSDTLTLPASLPPAANTSASVAAAMNGSPYRTLKVDRKKAGINLSAYLTPRWSTYLDLTNEERTGARPYGGPFAESWLFPGAAVLETIKPIHDSTINSNMGIRFVDATWRADLGYSGSFYRSKYQSYSFEQPFVGPDLPSPPGPPAGATVAHAAVGQMSLEPDNDYHDLHAALTRVLPRNGELSLTLSQVLMRQTDALIPPTNCQGYLGWGVPANGSFFTPTDVGPQNPKLFDCSQWNTPASLSQRNANVSLRNTLAELRLSLQPVNAVNVTAGVKYYRQKYDNNYLPYNPLNGVYGYVGENGGFIPLLGLSPGLVNGPGTLGLGAGGVRALPFLLSMEEYNAYGSATWKISERRSLGFTYDVDRYKPTHRERERVDDRSLKLVYVDKSLSWATLRVNYTHLQQTGDLYDTEVSGYAYAYSIPALRAQLPRDFVPAPETVAQLRKYDVGDRTQNKIDLMATIAPRDDLTVSASFRGDWNTYDRVLLGRQAYRTWAAQLSTEWTPILTSSISAYVGYDRSTIRMASVAATAQPGVPPCHDLGCPYYPLENRWWQSDRERNYSAGLTALHRIGHASFDMSWNAVYSRGDLRYGATSVNALNIANPAIFAAMGNGMPPTTYRVNSITIGATVPLNDRISLRLFDYYERGRINDWHYYGLDQSYVIPNQNTLYSDGGPQSYEQNLVGLLMTVIL